MNEIKSVLRVLCCFALTLALCGPILPSRVEAARLAEEGGAASAPATSAPPIVSPAPAPPAPSPPGRTSPARRTAPPTPNPTQPAAQPAAPPATPPAPQPAAEMKRPAPGDRITINFDNADLRTVIKFISELTGKNFVVDEKVKGTVTIISPTEITADEAYYVFLSVLEMKGFTVVESGKVYKVFPAVEARYRDIETIKGDTLGRTGREDRMITQLVPLRYASANDLKGILTPLVSKESQIASYGPTNTLIITDYASNLRRLLSMIQEMDMESTDEKITVHPLKYASAPVLANELLSLMDRAGQKGVARRTTTPTPVPTAPVRPGTQPPPSPTIPGGEESVALSASKLVADERTNSLIIIASDAETQKIMSLVEKLDVPLPPGRNKIHVYYLENAKAEEVIQVLSSLSGRGGAGGGFQSGSGTTGRTGLGTGSTGLGTGGIGSSGLGSASGLGTTGLGSTGLGSTGLGSTSSGSRTGRTGGAGLFGSGLGSGPRAALLGEDVQVVADKATNALIIMASPTDYEILKDLIEKLDIWRSQVLVEGLIAEVSLNKTKSLGVEWQGFKQLPLDTTVLGGTGPAGVGTSAGQPALDLFNTVGQLALGVFTGPITIAGQQFLNLKAVLRAFQNASDVNILSTPHILTLNNEEAEIVVAQNIPFLKSQTGTAESTTTTGGTASTAVLQTFEFKDVGITLRITPQISKGKFVRLNIFQEVSDVGAATTLTTTPTTFKRQAKTVVVVQDGQTVVIGGLIQDSRRESVSGPPCLASVPVLGNLFRTQTVGPQDKRNLLIFITPHIVNTPGDMADITDQKRQEYDRDEKQFQQWRSRDFDETLDMILK